MPEADPPQRVIEFIEMKSTPLFVEGTHRNGKQQQPREWRDDSDKPLRVPISNSFCHAPTNVFRREAKTDAP